MSEWGVGGCGSRAEIDRLILEIEAGDGRAVRQLQALVASAPDGPERDDVLDRLAAAARHGEPGPALDFLVDQLYALPFLRSEIRRVLVDDGQAAEALQETILAIVRALATFRGESLFRTWAKRVARNQSIGVLRREREGPGETGDVAEMVGEVERFSSVLARREDLRIALARLPPEFEEVVRLRDLERLTYGEIAERLGIELNTVRSRLARGRARLAAEIANY